MAVSLDKLDSRSQLSAQRSSAGDDMQNGPAVLLNSGFVGGR